LFLKKFKNVFTLFFVFWFFCLFVIVVVVVAAAAAVAAVVVVVVVVCHLWGEARSLMTLFITDGTEQDQQTSKHVPPLPSTCTKPPAS